MTQVMISYRNIDGQKEFADVLEQALAKAGFSTWIDKNNIPPLSRWEDEIFKGIKNSDFVILCLSPEYFESEICLLECYVARGYGKNCYLSSFRMMQKIHRGMCTVCVKILRKRQALNTSISLIFMSAM